MKLFAEINPFATDVNKYVMVAENGWKITIASDYILFNNPDPLFIVDAPDGTRFVDQEISIKLEIGISKKEWFVLFPNGIAFLEVLQNENDTIYYDWLKNAEAWEAKGKPRRQLSEHGIFMEWSEDIYGEYL